MLRMILWLHVFLILSKQCSKEVTATFREVWMMGPLKDYQQQEGQRNLPRADKLTFLLSPTAQDVLYSRPWQLLWLLRTLPRAAAKGSVYHNRHFRGKSTLRKLTWNRNGINTPFPLFPPFPYSHSSIYNKHLLKRTKDMLK